MPSPEQIVRCLKSDFEGDLRYGADYAERIARNAAINPWAEPGDAAAYAQAARQLRAEFEARPARDHETLNRVIFTPEQARRIECQRPVDGVPVPTASGFELAAYRTPNGARFVTLCDDSQATWEAYCAEQAARASSETA